MAVKEDLATKEVLANGVKIYLRIKQNIKELQDELKMQKEEIIDTMDFLGLKQYKTEGFYAHWVIPKQFDELKFCAEHPDLHKQFCKTISYEEFNKKQFKKLHPEIHDKYLKEMTARLTIK